MLQRDPNKLQMPHVYKKQGVSMDALDKDTYSLAHLEFEHDNQSLTPLHEDDRRYDDNNVEDHELSSMRGLRDVEKEMLRLRASGLSQLEISKLVGCSQGQVSHSMKRIREKLRWGMRFKTLPSKESLCNSLQGFRSTKTDCARAALKTKDIAAIVLMYLRGVNQLSIGRTYGFSQGSIRAVLHRAKDHLMVTQHELGVELEELLKNAKRLVISTCEYKRTQKFKREQVKRIKKCIS
jgi:DNA-directed RNA polymerase specialized sigma24 family protein